ncbi:MAG: inverse autotransporter beta domain-containing protein [Parachlamydia sp.]|nr:inverse autotransporter beta domain-containing protein [Parachlamydia sp.]
MKYLLSVLFFLVCGSSVIHSQECGFYQPDTGFLSSIGSLSHPGETSGSIQFEIGYALGKFIGIKKSYAEIGLLIAPEPISYYQPLADFKIYRFTNGRWASSMGIGARWWDSCSRIWGANLFFDHLQGSLGNFNRFGAGLELFTDLVDLRLNAYLPFSSEKSRDGIENWDPFRETENVFWGLDFEAGRRWCLGYNLVAELAAGPYYYHHKDVKSIYGAMVRAELFYLRYFSLECRVSDDNLYKANFQAKITLTLPLFELFCSKEQTCNPITQPIQRTGVMFTKHESVWVKKQN